MLKVGDKAPLFEGVNQDGEVINFAGKAVILYFYPKDNTPGCSAEGCNLNENLDMWREKGYTIIGCSPDSEASHRRFIEKKGFKFDLISDPEKLMLEAYDAWGLKKMYGREYMGVLRKTFVIDAEGVITHIFEKVKTKAHSEQIIAEM